MRVLIFQVPSRRPFSVFAEVREIAEHASDDPTLTPREVVILKQLASCCHDYSAGIAPQAGDAEKQLSAASRRTKEIQSLSANAKAWQRFVTAAVSSVPVETVRGTDRLVGLGMLKLGQLVWRDAVDVDEDGQEINAGKYAAFLVGPLRQRLYAMKAQASVGSDDMAKLKVILDTIRAIPYTATAYDDEKLNEAFYKFVEVAPLDCQSSPNLAAVQKEMVDQDALA